MQEQLSYADKRRAAILDGLDDYAMGAQLARLLDGSLAAEEEAKSVRAAQEAAANILQRRVRVHLANRRVQQRQAALQQVATFETEARMLRDALMALQTRVQTHSGEASSEHAALAQQLAAAIAALRL
jgi:hypothetical protein